MKWKRYRFFPAVEILRMFCRGLDDLSRVGSVSIYFEKLGIILPIKFVTPKFGVLTIFKEASARLMKVGATSPS